MRLVETTDSTGDLRALLPFGWRKMFDAHRLERPESLGESSAILLKVTSVDSVPAEYLKLATGVDGKELRQEIACLNWLGDLSSQESICTPQVLAALDDLDGATGQVALRMSAVEGTPLSVLTTQDPAWIVAAAAEALAKFHRLPSTSCPFDQTIQTRLTEATRRVASGIVDPRDFDEERCNANPADLLIEVKAMAETLFHEPSDLVVTHGDANLSNLLLNETTGRAGFVDCGRLGIADRYMDLAIMADSVASTFGKSLLPVFWKSYGVRSPDHRRLTFYKLLDEFF